MVVPEFPDSREVTLDDKPHIDGLLAAMRPEISAYTFTNMFAWRDQHHIRLSRLGESIIAHYNDGVRTCLEPLGGAKVLEVVKEAFARAPGGDLEFAYVGARLASRLREDPAYTVTEDRDNSDYLYRSEDLIGLVGRKYDAKRNFINRLRSRFDYNYEKLDGRLAMECFDFAEEWCEDRSCETVEGMRKEHCAVYQILTNFDALGVVGGAIRIDGRIVAFSVGEALNPETLVVHIEKADGSIEGLYQTINNEFCIHEAKEYEFVNREQDMGVPGLRKAKESYHPVRLVETYRVKHAS
jgi:hypothetical protein